MTAALRLVPDLEPSIDDQWLIQTTTTAWEPERHLIGALMYLTASEAQEVLDLVPDNAIGDPAARWAYELIRRVVDAGQHPDPITVLGAGRHHGATQSPRPGTKPSEHQHHQLALYLVDASADTLSPTAVANCIRVVLDDAYRRAFDTFGLRMQQLAAAGTDRDDLAAEFAVISEELDSLRRRTEEAERRLA